MGDDIKRRVAAITRDPDYASQLTSMITELGLNDEEANIYFSTLNLEVLEENLMQLNVFNEIAKYKGFNPRFNPREMFQTLRVRHAMMREQIIANPALKEEHVLTTVIDGEEKTFRFSNNMGFEKDMEYIILMFITRGTAYNIFRDNSEVMKACMQLMKNKYNINTMKRRLGLSLDAKTITVPRIAATFPNLTVDFFHKGFGRRVFNIDTVIPGVVLPRAVFSPMMPSLLAQVNGAPLALMILIAVKTDDVLNQVGQKTNMEQIYAFTLASYNSTGLTNSVKIKYCVRWGLGTQVNGTFTYTEEIIETRASSIEQLRLLRPNDPTLAGVISKL